MITVLLIASVFLASPQDFAAPPTPVISVTEAEAPETGTPETDPETDTEAESETETDTPEESPEDSSEELPPEPVPDTPPANVGHEEEGGDEAEPTGPGEPIPYSGSAFNATSLTAPVTIDSYNRDYEGPKSDAEQRYEAGIESGKLNRQNQAQTLEGTWRVHGADNAPLLRIEFRATGTATNRRLEGAWRIEGGGVGLTASGFVDVALLAGRELEISYFPGKARAPNILHLRRQADGLWHGTMMMPDGQTRPVTLAPVR